MGKIGAEGHLFNRFTDALQRMARLVGCIEYLIDLGGRDITRIDAADAFAVQMDLEHDLRGCFAVLAEEFLQNDDDKLHGRVVVVEHQHLVHLRGFRFLGAPLQHDRTAVVRRRPLYGRHGGD